MQKEPLKQIELLEAEMKLMQDNIKRLRERVKEEEGWCYNLHVFGELKHRCVAMKQRLSAINKLSTSQFF